MKVVIRQWLSQRTQVPGVLACGVRFPDKTACTQTWSPDFPAASLDNAWRCVSDAFQVIKHDFFPNQRVRWVYENALLFCTCRDDGIGLGIFTAKDAQSFDANEVEQLIAEFTALGPAAAE